MEGIDEYLEDLIQKCGGLGRFQLMLITVTLLSKIGPTWSTLVMTFAGYKPEWECFYDVTLDGNLTNRNQSLQACHPPKKSNISECDFIQFDTDKHTIVNEFSLICDKAQVTSLITTIQMAGLFVSGLISGHLSDALGRKPTFFMSILLLISLNLVAGFSVSWQMFAVMRFLLGLGIGCYLTVFYTYLLEFIPARYRALAMSVPSWAMWAAIMAGFAKWLRNWKYLHFATAALTAPWMVFVFVLPESFRWLMSQKKTEGARNVVVAVAKFNRKPIPDLQKIEDLKPSEADTQRSIYSVKDIFTSARLRKYTFLIGPSWLACGYVYYAISFGVQSLSGDLYLNMFLLSLVEIPALILMYFMANSLGRRWTGIIFFSIACAAACGVTILQYQDATNLVAISACALVSKIGVSAGWAAIMVLTTEIYPTVVRSIGYGFHNSVSRIGAMVAPQMVFLNEKYPGVLYILCAGLMLASALCTLALPDTKNIALETDIQKGKRPVSAMTLTVEKAKVNTKPSGVCQTNEQNGLDNFGYKRGESTYL